jgi:ABC-type sugar transport system substrate-binding protein
MSNAGDPYFANKSYGYFQYARQDPSVEVKYYNAGGYDHLDVQIRQIEDAITSGYDVLVVTAVDSKGVCPSLKDAIDKGKVVVADDTGLDCSFQVPLFITENSAQVGYSQCKFIADRQGGKGGIVALWGPAGPAHIHRRQLGCLDALKQYPGITLLGAQYSQTSGIDDGLKLTEDFITRFGHQIGGIYSAGAVLATGAAKALQGAGYKPGDVTLVGIDMTSDSLKEMNDGWFQGIQASQPIRLAYATIEYGVQLARGNANIPGGVGVLPCCQRVIFTTDYMVVTPDLFKTFPTDMALAPPDWKPPV